MTAKIRKSEKVSDIVIFKPELELNSWRQEILVLFYDTSQKSIIRAGGYPKDWKAILKILTEYIQERDRLDTIHEARQRVLALLDKGTTLSWHFPDRYEYYKWSVAKQRFIDKEVVDR